MDHNNLSGDDHDCASVSRSGLRDEQAEKNTRERESIEREVSSIESVRGISEALAPFSSSDNVHRVSLEAQLSTTNNDNSKKELSGKSPALPTTERTTNRVPWIGDIFEILCLLAFFSIWGALARLGLSSLEGYPGAAVQPLVWAQFVGCVVMGALAELKDFFVVADGRNLQLFVGLSTGFCGSFTTFSSWMSTTFLAMANAQPSYDRPRGYSVLGLIDGITLTLAFSLTGLRFGREVGVFIRHLWTKSVGPKTNKSAEDGKIYGFNLVSGRRTVPTMNVLAVGLGAGCWIGVLLMCIFIKKWRGTALFAATFGPMGTFLRWYVSRKLNPLNPRFPIGTFTANIFGTIVIGCLMIGQQRVYQRSDPTACQVLQGLMDGFCGCLTTISTFVLELVTLERRNAWTYGSVSVVCGVLCMCLTAGVDHWRFRAHEVVSC